MSLLHRQRIHRQRKRVLSRKRQFARGLWYEDLESRIALDGTGLAGNECLPDLDLSGITAQTVRVGEAWTLNLLADGATATDEAADGTPTGDAFHFQLDPDVGVDVPNGVVLVDADGNTVETNADGAMTWTPTTDQVGTHTIMILMMDAGSPVLADSEKLTVIVTEADSSNTVPPVLDLNGAATGTDFATTFTEGDAPIAAVDSAGLTVTDVDGSNVLSASIVLSNAPDGAAEAIAVSSAGTALTVSGFDSSTGRLEISGEASLATYQSVLRTLTYDNTSATPTVGDRTIEIIVNDGLASTPVTSTVTVQRDDTGGDDNVAPNITSISDQTLVVGETVELTVTASDSNAGDTLTFQLDADNSPSSATLVQVDNATATLRWTPVAGDGPGPHSVRVLVTDNGDPALSDAEEFNITVQFPAAVDLNGAADGVDFAVDYDPAIGSVSVVAATAFLTDIDSTTTSLTASLASAPDGTSETLVADTTGTNVTANFVNGVLTLSNAGSVTELEQVLRTVAYSNSASLPTAGVRSITMTPLDGGLTTSTAVSTVTVPAVGANSAPTITEIADQTFMVGEVINIDVFAADSDDDTLTFSLDANSSGATITKTSSTTAQIQWTPTTAGSFDFLVAVVDDGSPVQTASEAFTLTIGSQAAAAPVIDLNGAADGIGLAIDFSEDGGAIDLGALVTVSDADSTQIVSATVSIVNLMDFDDETLSVDVGDATIGSSYVNGLLTLVGAADIATYQSILNTLTYENASQDPSTVTRIAEFQVSDGENLSGIATAMISVIAVEDAPAITAPASANIEAMSLLTIDVTATDPEGDAVAFSLQSAPETASITDNGNGSATVSWTPASEGDFTITVLATGANDVNSTADIRVLVAAFNSPPIVDLNGSAEGIGSTATFTEDGGPVSLGDDLAIVDDGDVISSATVTITNVLDGDAESLSVSLLSNDFSSSYDSGVLTITGPSTVASFQSVLQTLVYDNTSQSPSEADRRITVTVNDSGKGSDVATSTVTIEALNDPPVIAQPDFVFIEIGTELTVDIVATDPDGDAITLRLDELTSPADARLVDNGDGTGTITWTPTTAGDFAFVVAARDDDATMPLETNIAIGINAHPPNTAPVVDLNGPGDGINTTATFIEDGGPRSIVTTDVEVHDAEMNDIWNGTITLTNRLDGDDEVLAVVTRHTDVTATYDAGVVTLMGRGTLDQYMNILESLSYENSSDNPSTDDRLIEVVLSDGVVNSGAAAIQVSVTSVNDAPVGVAVQDQMAIRGEVLEVPVSAVDPDAAALSFVLGSSELTGAEIVQVDDGQVLRWTPASDFAAGEYTATVVVSDDGDPMLSDTIQFQVTVGDRPTLDLNGPGDGTSYSGTWLFGGQSVPILMPDQFTLEDNDSASLASALVSIVDPTDGADELVTVDVSNTNIRSAYDATTNVLMLSGVDTIENYRAVIATLSYDNTSDAPSFAPRSIRLSVSDGVFESSVAVSTILVQSEPDGSDTIESAEALGLAKGETQTLSGLIDSGADVDIFEFSARDGQTIFVNVEPATTLDLHLRMFDASGTEVALMPLPVGDGTEMLFVDVASDGDYFLGISSTDLTDYDPNDVAQRTGTMIGAYTVNISRFTTGTGDDTIPLATATTVVESTATDIADALDTGADVDMFAVAVTAEQLLEVQVDDADDDVRLLIFDALGRDITIPSTDADFASAMLGFDGTVYVAISSDELSEYHPLNPEGRISGTVTDYEIELSLSVPSPATADVDEAISDLFGTNVFSP